MFDDRPPTHQERLNRQDHLSGRVPTSAKKESEPEAPEGSCPAFGYLRGIRDRAEAVEFRLRDGNSVWFPYAWLGNWKFNPSEGLLLKFSGDMVYLVLIRGSNLDRPVSEGGINLMRAGIQRHRVLWLREMDEAEAKSIGDSAPTIDSIEIGECESQDEAREWIKSRAPRLG